MYLAGGVPRQRQAEFVLRNAVAVVADGDAAYAAALEPDFDALRARIDGVLENLFKDRGGTLDDFAGRALADQQVGRRCDGAALWHGTELLEWRRGHPSSAPPARQAP